MSWTDERVKKLTQMWNDGKSASEIAKDLGDITRNAVIGKVHRLGLSNRVITSASPRSIKKSPKKATPTARKKETATPASATKAAPNTSPLMPKSTTIPPRKPIIRAGQPLPPQPSANEISEEALAKMALVEQKAKKLSLMELTEKTCKWPVGDPATEDFWFCGLTVESGKPYCEAHNGVAFQPIASRRDRRR